MAKTWIGRKKIAFIPVFRPNAQPPDIIPADWANQILQRVLFNPDPTIQADRSLRAYIRAASSGLADLDVVVMPMASIEVPNADVRLEILDQQLDGPGLQAQGFDAAAAVMLGGAGSGYCSNRRLLGAIRHGRNTWDMGHGAYARPYWI